jgi:hypothetical protein
MAYKKSLSPRVKAIFNELLEQFKTGNVTELISVAAFPPACDSPGEKRSFLNRIITLSAGTKDARTFLQWKDVGRMVKKGSRAIYILAPIVRKTTEINDDGEAEPRSFVSGFRALPVFRYEDTIGTPLKEEQAVIRTIPFYSRALEWGINVTTIPINDVCLGFYAPTVETIALATPNESVFFHELAHAAHRRVYGELKPGQDAMQEIVAELSAAVLCKYAGKQLADSSGNSYQYIKKHAEELDLCPYQACRRVLSDVEKVLSLIIHGDAPVTELQEAV